jgi:Outer membrane protein beta-barrel domain
MKSLKGLWMLAAWSALAVSPSFAADQLNENQKWIEQADGGLAFPVSPAASKGYAMGYGGDILVGYRFTREFSLSADLGYYDCDQKGLGAEAGEWIYVPILAVARYNFGSGWVRPYLLFGAGAAVNTYTLTPGYTGKLSKRETDPLVSPGAGLLFIVARDAALYFQVRWDLNFSTPEGPFSDSPAVFMPVKGGISLFVL